MGPAQVGSRHRLHLQGDRATSNALPTDRATSSALPCDRATSSTLPGDRLTSSTLRGQGLTTCHMFSLIITVLLTGAVHLNTYHRAVELGPCSELDMQVHDVGGELRVSRAPARITQPAAAPPPGQAPAERDTVLDTLPMGMFNPSVIVHEGEAWAVVRAQYIMPDNRWALGKNHMVQLNLTRWSVESIHMFDPWQHVSELGVPCKRKQPHTATDVWGPDDTKLFAWPGNGVWAMTAGRPRIQRCLGACCNCTQLVFQQWLVQVAREGEPLDPTHFGKSLQPVPPYNYPGWQLTAIPETGSQDLMSGNQSNVCGRSTADGLPAEHGNQDWRALWLAAPLPMTLADAATVYDNRTDVEEKNWMLFSTGKDLYFTYELAPVHRVYRVHPNGRAEPVSDTNSSSVFAPLGVPYHDIHGGPSIIHITSKHLQAAGLPDDDYLLGVVHYHERVYYAPDPMYQHFLVKIEPQPPFRILQLSAELILRFVDKTWYKQQVAFVSGLQVAMLKPRAEEPLTAPRRSSAAKHLKSIDLPDLLSGNDGLVPHVLFSYGSADYESRVLVLPLVEVEQLFSSASWNNDSSKRQLQQGVDASHDLPSLDRSIAQAVQAHTPGPPSLDTVLQRRKHGAAVLYWHMQQCGGVHMCSALHKANRKMLSCWTLLPASAAPDDAEQECHCSGPEHASLSYFDQEQLQSFIQTHSWVDAFFADAGMPRYPYFGAKAVQVAVLRDPITRYLAHVVHEGKKHTVVHFRPKLNLTRVILQRAHEWHWLVPDNYMTRFLCGHWALQDHGYLSRPVTPGMFEQALTNLQRMDIVLVLEEAHKPEVGALLAALGLSPFGLNPAARSELANLYNVTGTILEQVVSWHSYDMQLYSYARKRHEELLHAWKKVK